mmetsp:Transcript_98320/g.155486  ORF Transcript_98320/g.155486 Transcript_98320/m.155486 type:complete len:271 (-) Transcript_98320:2133-2945(-)
MSRKAGLGHHLTTMQIPSSDAETSAHGGAEHLSSGRRDGNMAEDTSVDQLCTPKASGTSIQRAETLKTYSKRSSKSVTECTIAWVERRSLVSSASGMLVHSAVLLSSRLAIRILYSTRCKAASRAFIGIVLSQSERNCVHSSRTAVGPRAISFKFAPLPCTSSVKAGTRAGTLSAIGSELVDQSDQRPNVSQQRILNMYLAPGASAVTVRMATLTLTVRSAGLWAAIASAGVHSDQHSPELATGQLRSWYCDNAATKRSAPWFPCRVSCV